MCRIIGCIYGPDGPEAEEHTPSEMARMMFPPAVQQGPHAWGWMSYSGGDQVDIFKQVGRCDTKKAISVMDIAPDCKWWIGHTRYATHGDPDELVNDHPILHGHIMGVHNGIISNYERVLAKTGRQNHGTTEKPEYAEVDSEAIFAAINKWGNKKGLEMMHGGMAVVYVDLRYPDSVRIARTDGRTLYLAWTPTGSLIFGSEPRFITGTGITCTVPSQLMTYRMLQVKGGKIRRRVNLELPEAAERATVPVRSHRYPLSADVSQGLSGVTDLMSREISRRDQRRAEAADWHRPHHNERTRPTPKLGETTARQMPRTSPAARKREQLKIQLLHAADGSEPRRGATMQNPGQARKVQENGTYDHATRLYWWDGMLVDLDTYVDCLLGGA